MIGVAFSAQDAMAQGAVESDALVSVFLLFCLVVIILYFLPSLVAFARKHPNRWSILVVNLFFGATGLGWFGSLLWACNALHLSNTGCNGGESGLNLFVNDSSRFAAAEPVRLPIEELERLKVLLDQSAIDMAEHSRLKRRLLNE